MGKKKAKTSSKPSPVRQNAMFTKVCNAFSKPGEKPKGEVSADRPIPKGATLFPNAIKSQDSGE